MTATPHSKFSLNQATIKYASLQEAIEVCTQLGIPSIGVWREPVAEVGLDAAVKMLVDANLHVSSLCRGGFFTTSDSNEKRESLDDNKKAIEETASLQADTLVLVCGGLPEGDKDISAARSRVRDMIEELVPFALEHKVQLAIEPLHPIFAADRAVVSTLGQALEIATDFPAEAVGVVVDTYHVWWDPDLPRQIARAGMEQRIASYQVCDWMVPIPADNLLGRGFPGTGHIDFADITKQVVATGYDRAVEVEIFHQDIWDMNKIQAAQKSVESFNAEVTPYLP